MSTSVFPTLSGLAIGMTRSPIWLNRSTKAVSGKETSVALWSYPQWQWELPFDFLRYYGTYAEFQALTSFYNSCRGTWGSFLFEEPDDNTVIGQMLGVTDGQTTAYQLVRAFGGAGGFVEPIWAPKTVSAVYLDGGKADPSTWSVAGWETSAPGQLIFAKAPASGHEITADFSYYFPCRFNDDQIDFKKIAVGFYSLDSLTFHSLK